MGLVMRTAGLFSLLAGSVILMLPMFSALLNRTLTLQDDSLIGGALLILAFGAVVLWGMRVASKARTRYAQLAAAGLTTTIFFYVTVNLMMVMGLAPVVGIPLPLVSFGGSAVMTVMICLGLLMGFERQQRTKTSLS